MAVGVITTKYKITIIIGEVILLNKMPNLYQTIFGLLRILLKKIAVIRKNNEAIKDNTEKSVFLS